MFKKIVLTLVVFLLSTVSFAQPKTIDVHQLKQMMDDGVVLIDVRTPSEWTQTGIVPKSHAIMFFDEKRKPHPQEWLHHASQYIAADKKVAIICRSGVRSQAVAEYLVSQHGYEQVYNVKGGMKAWMKAGNATVKP